MRQSAPAEWFQWRGPNRDGHSAETGLLKEWPANGPPQVWRTTGAGTGFASFSSSGGRLYTLGARGNVEYVIAFDAATGQAALGDAERPALPQRDGRRPAQHADDRRRSSLRVRRHRRARLPRHRHRQQDLVGERRAAVRRDDAVLGLQRIAAHRRRSHRAQRRRTQGVDRRREQGGRHRRSGRTTTTRPATRRRCCCGRAACSRWCSSPAERALAVDPRDGRLLWSYNRASNNTANIATPIVRGNRVFFSSDYGTGAALLDVKAAGNVASAEEVYFTREMRNHHASSVVVGDTSTASRAAS